MSPPCKKSKFGNDNKGCEMKKAILNSTIFCSIAMGSFTAVAQQPYVALDVGRSTIDLGVSGIDDTDTSFAISGGITINEHFAAEVGYIDFGEISASGNGSISVGADAITFSAIGILPISDKVGLTGRLGMDFWDAEAEYKNVPGFGSGTESDDGNDIFFGVGALIGVSDSVKLRLEYQLHELDDVDVDVLSVGASFFF